MKTHKIAVLIVVGAVVIAALSGSQRTWVEAWELYPSIPRHDSSVVPGFGSPIAIWAENSLAALGPPHSKILWDGVMKLAMFSIAVSAIFYGASAIASLTFKKLTTGKNVISK